MCHELAMNQDLQTKSDEADLLKLMLHKQTLTISGCAHQNNALIQNMSHSQVQPYGTYFPFDIFFQNVTKRLGAFDNVVQRHCIAMLTVLYAFPSVHVQL